MATKKSSSKTVNKKSTIIKIAETIGMVAGEISVKKDQVVAMASNVIGKVKNKKPEKSTATTSAKMPVQSKPALKPAKIIAAKKSTTKKEISTTGEQKNKKGDTVIESKNVKKDVSKKAAPQIKLEKKTQKKSGSPEKSKNKKKNEPVAKPAKSRK